MTNYCKSNVRRVINYTNKEPLNKYDLWLSENLRYNEDGELEYDNNGQPACDLILKIFRNGKWEPIVGYNTASENKMNIVKGVSYTYTPINYPHTTHTNYGFQENHLPLFRDPQDSPDELFDAGTLGEAICGFVTESEWNSIFQTDWFTNAFNTSIIGGNDYNWSNLIQELISGGDVTIPLANTQRIGGIKAAQDPNTADDCRNIPIVLAGPTVGSVWGLPFGSGTYPGDSDYNTEYLYLPGWALMEWMKNPYFNQQNPQPFITGWKGVDIQLRQNSDLLWVGLSGVIPENTGKVCTVQLDNTDPSGATIEWVNLPEATEYSAGTGITISQSNQIGIDTNNAQTNQVLTKTSNGVGWTTPQQGETYTAGNGIEIDENQNNAISQHIERIEIGNPPSLLYVTYTGVRDALQINGSSYGITVNAFDFYYNPTASDYVFSLVSGGQQIFSTNPIYLRINANYIELGSTTNYISNVTPTNGRFQKGEYFVIIQFGFVKLELISTI